MSSSIDAQALLMACMADLGRERQDELPLSDKAKRGPTFLPGRGTGATHIPSQLRKKLSQGWKAKIDDGESKQMEGLDFEDSRPWAKQRDKDKQVSSVKPAAPQKNSGNSKLRNHQAALLATVQKKAFAAQIQQRSKKHETKTVSEASIIDKVQEYTVCRGHCKIVNGANEHVTRTAEFALKANVKTDRGFLTLKPVDGGEIIYDVLDLNHPTINGNICAVSCRRITRSSMYHLCFQKSDEAQDFQRYLKTLQDSAAHNVTSNPTSPRKKSSSFINNRAENAEKTVTDPSQIQQTNTVSAGSSIQAAVPDSTITPSQDVIDEAPYVAPVENLIDFDDIAPSAELGANQVYGGTFEDTAVLLLDIIHTILNCIQGPISKETIENVEETVFKNWKGMAPMEFEDDDDLREDMQQFLRSAINIKLKRDIRKKKMLDLTIPAIADLHIDDAPRKAADRIQYTATEMLDCRTNQDKIIGPKGLQSSRWAKPLNAEAAVFEPHEIPNSEAVQVMEKSQKVQPDIKNQPGLKGLSTSRWAETPVEFEGHFAGIE